VEIWREAQELEIKNILQDRIDTEMEELIRKAQRDEWDNIIAAKLESSRKTDQYYDIKLAWLVYCNDEIGEEEWERRWDTIDSDAATRVIEDGNWTADCLWPQSLHPDNDEVPFAQEELDTIIKNFPRAVDAIKKAPDFCLQRRRLEAPDFWRVQREERRSNFEKELSAFREKKKEFGGNLQKAVTMIKKIQGKLKGIDEEISQRRRELQLEIERIRVFTEIAMSHIPQRLSWGPASRFTMLGPSSQSS
jgi:hypothetical protein